MMEETIELWSEGYDGGDHENKAQNQSLPGW